MNIGIRFAAAVALALLAIGCSQRDPAQSAVTAAENALAAVSEDAIKYVPDQYGEVKASLDQARTAFGEERYKDAIDLVMDIPARAETLATHAAAARQAFLEALGGDWARLAAALPGQLGAIESRLAELGKSRRLPTGLDPQRVTDAGATFATAKGAWDSAAAAFGAGDLEGAVAKAQEIEGMAQELRSHLGMPAN